MAIKINPLTDSQIKAFKPTEKKFKKFDGDGLMLAVYPNGSKLWEFRYKAPATKKIKILSLGAYPVITLQRARELREDARKLIKSGIDPQLDKKEKEQQRASDAENTLLNVAKKWIELEKEKGQTEKTISKKWGRLKNHILPVIGNVSIKDITAPIIIQTLQPLKKEGKAETIKRICIYLNGIMAYAVNSGIINHNPLINIKSVFPPVKAENRQAIPPQELPEFLNDLENAKINPATKNLILFQFLTMVRPAEATGAKWCEIDFNSKIWTIPADKMKTRKPHNVPLSPQVMRILDEIKNDSFRNSDFIFTSFKAPYDKPMSSQTANMAIKRMGYKDKLCAHGLRTLASTILNEHQFNPDLIEKTLAHTDKNSIRAIYNRADYLEQRRSMMSWLADYVDKARRGEEIPLSNNGFYVVNG